MPLKTLLACALLLAFAGCAPAPDPAAAPQSAAYVRHMAPDQYDTWRGVHYDALLLDVRTLPEWNDDLAHLDDALQVPVEELEARLGELDRWRDKAVMIYDRSGTSTTRAGQILVNHGFRDVSVIDGGLKAYRDWQKTR